MDKIRDWNSANPYRRLPPLFNHIGISHQINNARMYVQIHLPNHMVSYSKVVKCDTYPFAIIQQQDIIV